jgi:single-strand DNA-binding protein
MNSLNSVLIEGDTVTPPRTSANAKGAAFCTFEIKSNRIFRDGDGIEEEVSEFMVQAWGKLADSCVLNITTGRGVRIVGRLKRDKDYGVIIVAEHVEWKQGGTRR